jgi:hypothetical protein
MRWVRALQSSEYLSTKSPLLSTHFSTSQNQQNAQISYIISIIAPTCFGLYDHPQGAHVQSPIHIYLQYDVKTEHCVMVKELKFVLKY